MRHKEQPKPPFRMLTPRGVKWTQDLYPSALVSGRAKKPKGLSLRQAFLSSASRPRATPAMSAPRLPSAANHPRSPGRSPPDHAPQNRRPRCCPSTSSSAAVDISPGLRPPSLRPPGHGGARGGARTPGCCTLGGGGSAVAQGAGWGRQGGAGTPRPALPGARGAEAEAEEEAEPSFPSGWARET